MFRHTLLSAFRVSDFTNTCLVDPLASRSYLNYLELSKFSPFNTSKSLFSLFNHEGFLSRWCCHSHRCLTKDIIIPTVRSLKRNLLGKVFSYFARSSPTSLKITNSLQGIGKQIFMLSLWAMPSLGNALASLLRPWSMLTPQSI